MHHCPKCDADISDSYQPDEPDVGICAGWYCDNCNIGYPDDGSHEPMEDDVDIDPIQRDKVPRTPISEISTQPGQPGYNEWLRISKSWGHD